MLEVLSHKKEIKKYQNEFVLTMRSLLKKEEEFTIGFPGGNFNNKIFYNDIIWYSNTQIEDVAVPRYWNGFGLEIREKDYQHIVVEINFPMEEIDRRVSGVFARDPITKEIFVLHRGKVGGGAKGVGKNKFKAWYRGQWTPLSEDGIATEEAILIAALNSKNLLENVTEFVQQVASFKKEIKTGKLTRRPHSRIKDDLNYLTFDPEFIGKKKGRGKSNFEYECNHGRIVNALEKHFRESSNSKHTNYFNSQLIDLGIEEKGEIVTICEVKSKSDRQSIYTGIGQLLFHTSGNSKVNKILVLPDFDDYHKFLRILNRLGISLIRFSLSKSSISFVT